MLIRTGLLHVPSLDADASAAVRAILRSRVAGAVVVLESAVGSQRNWVSETLRTWCDEDELDLLLTIGGTLPAPGPAAAECVPEATREVLERHVPGLSETMRAEAAPELPLALLDRGVAGIRSRTLVVNLPEGAAAAIFLGAIVDLIPGAVLHLQGSVDAPRFAPAGAKEEESTGEQPQSVGLDPAEFAAFLARRRGSPPGTA
ncbi:MAG: MogA/MoaB family molybdenum cofactor biosynthesis protein [Caldilineaceae bacterium]